MASKKLVRLAQAASKANAKAATAQSAWVEAFKAEYGHDEISDVLVEAIDYAKGDGSEAADITAEFIEAHSKPGMA